MNATDRQRLKILGILVVLLGITFWVGRQIYDVPALTNPVAGPGSIVSSSETALADLDLSVEWTGTAADAWPSASQRRNPFEYGPEPAPEVPVQPALPPVTAAPPQPFQPALPPPEPSPSPIPLRYSGYSTVGDSGQLQAWLFDEGDSYGVIEQEVLMGRYRIDVITVEYVDIEVLEDGRRERLPLFVE